MLSFVDVTESTFISKYLSSFFLWISRPHLLSFYWTFLLIITCQTSVSGHSKPGENTPTLDDILFNGISLTIQCWFKKSWYRGNHLTWWSSISPTVCAPTEFLHCSNVWFYILEQLSFAWSIHLMLILFSWHNFLFLRSTETVVSCCSFS